MIQCEVSVIMSFYNESCGEIYRAIDSIINQTFDRWELIVICDCPENIDLFNQVKSKYSSNGKIHVFKNDMNLGLACTMNKAANMSSGKYLARMDADDISEITRIEEQYDYMEEMQLDLSCTGFVYIDDAGNDLHINSINYNSDDIKKRLPYDNTIHHPTVMMKKTSFDAVGGYRDFPCTQDYDLWLRMYEKDMKMGIINKPLLKYTLRKEGISQSKKLKQLLTRWYIQRLHRAFVKNGINRYDKGDYELYLLKNHANDKAFLERFEKQKRIKDRVDSMRGIQSKKVQRGALMLRLFLASKVYRRYYIELLYGKVMIRIITLKEKKGYEN